MLCVCFVAHQSVGEQVTPLGQEKKKEQGDIFVLINWSWWVFPVNKVQKEASALRSWFLALCFLGLTILQDTVVTGWLCSMVCKVRCRFANIKTLKLWLPVHGLAWNSLSFLAFLAREIWTCFLWVDIHRGIIPQVIYTQTRRCTGLVVGRCPPLFDSLSS